MSDLAELVDLANLVDRYLAVWNEPDPAKRSAAIATLWTVDGSLTDPLSAAKGWSQIEAVIAGGREQLPGYVLRLTGPVDTHHNVARFGWAAYPEGGGEPPVVGFDVATATDDGKLADVYGFFDKLPAS
jgi:hypothetical protein